MNRTKIEWCDYTWNPVTGCRHNCPYCYARRIDNRFGNGQFTPTFHANRIKEPIEVKKPSKIFVGSVSDLFGNWVWYDPGGIHVIMTRQMVVEKTLKTVNQCPQHTFIFLTKNPKGMQGFGFPDNCWCGTSVENQEKYNNRITELSKVNCKTLFCSHEPALGKIDYAVWGQFEHPDNEGYGVEAIKVLSWLIVGAQTGPGAISLPPGCIENAIEQTEEYGISLFIKDNCKWPEQIREWPK